MLATLKQRPFVQAVAVGLKAKWVRTYELVAVALFAALISLRPAAAQSLNIDIDLTALFEQINNFLPVGIAIFAVPVGIVVAFTLIRFVANALIKAFNGQQL